jgi:HlyD family secretion protein
VTLLFSALAVSSNPRAETASGGKVLSLGVAATGVVEKILVVDGAHVKAGDVLLQLDCRPLEEEVKLRLARQDALQAAYERTRNGSRPEEIAIGEANVGVAQARAEEARDALGRANALTEGITITRAQFLDTQKNARVTAAQLEDAKKRLALLKAGSRQEDIDEALARRNEAIAGAAEAKARFDQCTLRAPVDGTVQVISNVGQFVSTYVPVTLLKLIEDAPH